MEASGEVREHAEKRKGASDECDATGEDRSPCFAVHHADTNSRACHAVPTEPILRSPVGVRRTDSKYAAKTITHSTSINTAIPAW